MPWTDCRAIPFGLPLSYIYGTGTAPQARFAGFVSCDWLFLFLRHRLRDFTSHSPMSSTCQEQYVPSQLGAQSGLSSSDGGRLPQQKERTANALVGRSTQNPQCLMSPLSDVVRVCAVRTLPCQTMSIKRVASTVDISRWRVCLERPAPWSGNDSQNRIADIKPLLMPWGRNCEGRLNLCAR